LIDRPVREIVTVVQPYTYILECSDGSFYVGSTIDLDRRLEQHALGAGPAYTRRRLPVRLVWCEPHDHVGNAFLREKQIQNWSRAKRLALIEQRLDDLPELARGWGRGRETGLDSFSPSGSDGSTN
jgi:putative endonuclease